MSCASIKQGVPHNSYVFADVILLNFLRTGFYLNTFLNSILLKFVPFKEYASLCTQAEQDVHEFRTFVEGALEGAGRTLPPSSAHY